MRCYPLALALAVAVTSAARAETVLSFSPRGNQAQFYALMNQAPNPVGSIVLLAGGHGRLDIKQSGGFTYLKVNQVVRTRSRYALQGFTTILPDIAADFKTQPAPGVVAGYRGTLAHAQDIGAVVAHLRAMTGKPVTVMGTSRGSIGVANVVSKLSWPTRPDIGVVSSAFLTTGPGLTVRSVVNNDPNLLAIPFMTVVNINDKCASTPPSEFVPFANWYMGNGLKLGGKSLSPNFKVDVDDCEARTPHGFWGWDEIFVLNMAAWLKIVIAGM